MGGGVPADSDDTRRACKALIQGLRAGVGRRSDGVGYDMMPLLKRDLVSNVKVTCGVLGDDRERMGLWDRGIESACVPSEMVRMMIILGVGGPRVCM